MVPAEGNHFRQVSESMAVLTVTALSHANIERQHTMFTIWFTNFGYAPPKTWNSFYEAVAAAREYCFECSISEAGTMIASWSPISGLRHW